MKNSAYVPPRQLATLTEEQQAKIDEIFETMPKTYEQDGICDTWEVLANMVYPGGLSGLRKKSKSSYSETGKAKCEWADKIGRELILENNISPSFRKLLSALQIRIEAA